MLGDPIADGESPSARDESLPLVEFRDIVKTFGATKALRGVSFNIIAGETVGLLGANGAGKSTLIKILAGIYEATSGEIVVEGETCEFKFPDDARNAGIATVHQNIDDGVVFGMSVAENLLLDEIAKPGGPIFLNRRSVLRRAQAVARNLQLDLPLTSPVEELSASLRQEVAIARELAKSPKLLILDEPTSTLSEREVEKLFTKIKELQARGIAILYISHRMSEIELLCDRAVVLRNGRIVSEHVAPMDTREIASSILGELVLSRKHADRVGKESAFTATGLRCRVGSQPINFKLLTGEVVGLTGLIGAGKTELLEQICGHRPLIAGKMLLGSTPYVPRDVADAMMKGVVMVPEERALQSVFPGETLWQHCSAGQMQRFSRYGYMDRPAERRFCDRVIEDFKVVAPGSRAVIEELSGGNQQKLLVGRWLLEEWELIVLDEPFRGIDIGARGLISQSLRRYSKSVPVLVCSSDPEEVMEVADRVLIMTDAAIVHTDRTKNLTAESLAEIMSATVSREENARYEATTE